MNITKEQNGLTEFLKVELAAADYQEKVEKELKDYRKKVQLRGFRPGQVPAGLVKQMYGKAILVDAVNHLVAENIDKYFKDNKIDLLGHALPVEDEKHKGEMDFDHPSNFVFWFEYAPAPEVKVDLGKVKVKSYEVKVPDDAVEKQVESLCQRYGQMTHPETAGEKDSIHGQLQELNEEGEVKEGGIQVHTTIAIDKIALKTIQKQFIGKKADAKIDFDVTKAFKNKTDLSAMLNVSEDKLAEINPKFRFTVESIMHVESAVLGEDLYKKAYPGDDIKDEAGFREKIRSEIAGYYAQNTDKKFYVDTVEAVLESASFDMPEDFVKRWVLNENNRDLKEGQEPMADISEEEMKRVLKGIRWELVQNAICKDNEVKIEEQDLREFYKNKVLANYFPVNAKDEESVKRIDMFIDSMMKNQDEVRRVYDMVFEEKLTALFKEKVKATKKVCTMEEFIEELKKEQK